MLHVSYSVLDSSTSGIMYSIPSGGDRAVNSLHYLGLTRQLQWLAQGGESDKQNLTVGGKGENIVCILCMYSLNVPRKRQRELKSGSLYLKYVINYQYTVVLY